MNYKLKMTEEENKVLETLRDKLKEEITPSGLKYYNDEGIDKLIAEIKRI